VSKASEDMKKNKTAGVKPVRMTKLNEGLKPSVMTPVQPAKPAPPPPPPKKK
jgi:hypothetical protein